MQCARLPAVGLSNQDELVLLPMSLEHPVGLVNFVTIIAVINEVRHMISLYVSTQGGLVLDRVDFTAELAAKNFLFRSVLLQHLNICIS